MARKKNLGILPVIPRLMEMSIPEPNSGCWIWLRAMANGYGVIGINGRQQYAHRASFEAFNRPLLEGERALHRCDMRACINPEHLFAGSQRDNMQDAIAKGRAAFQRHPELFAEQGRTLASRRRKRAA